MEQEATELIDRGVKAFEAGNIAAARKFLSQAVKTEKRSETAWWYLAQAMDDAEKREYCLRMLLKLNPNHQQAQEALELGAAWVPVRPESKAQGAENGAGSGGGSGGGIRIPSGIPDAPEHLSPNELIAFTQTLVQDSIGVLTGKESIGEATWWNFFLTVGVTGFIIGLIADIGGLMSVIVNRTEFYTPTINLWVLITTPFLMVITAWIAVSVGCFVSHWYMAQRGGSETLVKHSYTLAQIWVPAALLLAILGLIDGLILSGSMITLISVLRTGLSVISNTSVMTIVLTLVAAGIAVYTAFLMSKALARLYPALSNREWWIGALLTLALISFVL